MFKKASATDELMSVMQKNLIKNAEGTPHRSLSGAIDLLDSAAEIFENAGMYDLSSRLVDIITEVAGKVTLPSDVSPEELNAKDS